MGSTYVLIAMVKGGYLVKEFHLNGRHRVVD
jgi:hypothetical protein